MFNPEQYIRGIMLSRVHKCYTLCHGTAFDSHFIVFQTLRDNESCIWLVAFPCFLNPIRRNWTVTSREICFEFILRRLLLFFFLDNIVSF